MVMNKKRNMKWQSTVKTTVKIYEKKKYMFSKQLIAVVWFRPQKGGRCSFDHSDHTAVKSHIILIISEHKLKISSAFQYSGTFIAC